jgi:hypothetical protein
VHRRCEKELKDAFIKAEKNREVGKKGGRPRKKSGPKIQKNAVKTREVSKKTMMVSESADNGFPSETQMVSANHVSQNPNPLIHESTTIGSVPIGTDTATSPPVADRRGRLPEIPAVPGIPDVRAMLWSNGPMVLQAMTGKPDGQVRKLIGRWLADLGDDCAALSDILARAVEERPVDPLAWISAAVIKRQRPKETPLRRAAAKYGVSLDEVPPSAPGGDVAGAQQSSMKLRVIQ